VHIPSLCVLTPIRVLPSISSVFTLRVAPRCVVGMGGTRTCRFGAGGVAGDGPPVHEGDGPDVPILKVLVCVHRPPFRRPSGTRLLSFICPALKRRAIFICPFGTFGLLHRASFREADSLRLRSGQAEAVVPT
jgi:hypothetical protein